MRILKKANVFLCDKCGNKCDWYVLNDEIWAEATKENPARFLCIGCLEKNLGRRLSKSDFAPVPLNFGAGKRYQSELMRDRIGEENYWN